MLRILRDPFNMEFFIIVMLGTIFVDASMKEKPIQVLRTMATAGPIREHQLEDRESGDAGYTHFGTGCAGPNEIWNLGNAKGQGVRACYEAVKLDQRCTKDYFTYNTRGDKNCGCKGSGDALIVQLCYKADYFKFKAFCTNLWSDSYCEGGKRHGDCAYGSMKTNCPKTCGLCPVDCAWGEYGQWSSCQCKCKWPATCDDGTTTRTRPKAITASNGGAPCTGSETETGTCKSNACPVCENSGHYDQPTCQTWRHNCGSAEWGLFMEDHCKRTCGHCYNSAVGYCRGGNVWPSGTLMYCLPGSLTQTDCEQACNTKPGCAAYDRISNVDQGECCLFKDGNTGDGSSGGRVCSVKQFGGSYSLFGLNLVVVDEGNKVQDHSHSDLEDCKDFCSKNIACKSFAYCPGHKNCHLKSMALHGTELTKNNVHCTTYFRKKDWELVAEKMECDGLEDYLRFPNIDDCATACKRVATMFAFGTNDFDDDDGRCNNDGCVCLCEKTGTKQGTCEQKEHDGYRLYKYSNE